MKLIIFTDLDGTLLDSNYSFEAALPALSLIKEKGIPLVICSSKTLKEIEHYRKKLYNLNPFISENGGGVFVPKGYFGFQLSDAGFQAKDEKQYYLIRLGAEYDDLRKALNELRTEGFSVKGFGDMTVEGISILTGLSIEEAEWAKERDFDEPFVFAGAIPEQPLLLDAIKKKGFNYTQGRFHHILGNSDKGKAVSILTDLFKKEYNKVATIAAGDSPNDIPMLEKVDYPVIVRKRDGEYDCRINIPGLAKADGTGPEGWNKAMIALINRLL
ncbi:MAG: HAD-IIB family hydrolase [Nitrospiraceae bacterium]|nr:MAG: HAD-IIB family hydrolase [Nitrospiraceae bacterium]